MRSFSRLFALLPFAATLFLGDVTSAAPPPSPPSLPSSGVDPANDFNVAMYKSLAGASKDNGNLFFSALGIREALGIAYLGAKGKTASEMSSAIHLDPNATTSALHAKSEMTDLTSAKGGATLAIANRLWTDKGFTMKPDFVTNAMNAYGSPVDPVDFAHAPNDARSTINAWVQKQTNDRIKDLLPPPSITTDTRLVITNAIYFKGVWATQFKKTATRDEPFFSPALGAGKAHVDVPMMHQTGSFAIATQGGVKVLEMPYDKSDLAMDVILPDSPTGLRAIEEKLDRGQLSTWTASLHKQKVDVTFPKLTFSNGASIKDPLKKLGMTTAFDEGNADFTGIGSARAAGGNLYVSDVIHKAFIAIDEEGSEAAASTAVIMTRETTSIEPPPIEFKADHPFVFFIRDVKHNRILFMGRVTNPKG